MCGLTHSSHSTKALLACRLSASATGSWCLLIGIELSEFGIIGTGIGSFISNSPHDSAYDLSKLQQS